MYYLRSILIWLGFAILTTACGNFNKDDAPWGQENAVWTEGAYLKGYRTNDGDTLVPKDIEEYALNLKKNNIKYAYLFAGPFGVDGHLPDYPFSETAKSNVEYLKSHYPELIILPWIGGVQNKQLYLGDTTWVKNALTDTKKLVSYLNVEGVHVDFEYIKKGEPALDLTTGTELPGDLSSYGNNVNNFHKQLRKILPNAFISSVVVTTAPKAKPWKRRTSMEELKVLVKEVDQLSFLFYDTSIKDQNEFRESCQYQLQDIQHLTKIKDIQYLIGVGTFINDIELQKYRHMEIENISNTIRTLSELLESTKSEIPSVDGVAIACYWTTADFDWATFRKLWVKP